MGINLNSSYGAPTRPSSPTTSQHPAATPDSKPSSMPDPVSSPDSNQASKLDEVHARVIQGFEQSIALLDASVETLKVANSALGNALKSGDVADQKQASIQVTEALSSVLSNLKNITEKQFPEMRKLPPAIKNQQKFIDLAVHVGQVAAQMNQLTILP